MNDNDEPRDLESRDLPAESDDLDTRINDSALGHMVRGLLTAGARERRIARWLVASVVLEVVLSLGLGYIFYSQQAATKQEITTARILAVKAADTARRLCVEGNDERALRLALWKSTFTFKDPLQQQALEEAFAKIPC